MGTRKKSDRFPLWLHPSGQWAKKVKGRTCYFGTDRDKALKRYAAEREDLEAGRRPRQAPGSVTMAGLANTFLTSKRETVDSGELTAAQWSEYHRTCETLVGSFGRERSVSDIRPEDFRKLRAKAAKRLGPFALAKLIQMSKTVFAFAFRSELIAVPIRYGDEFDKPTRRVMRLERAKTVRLISAADAWKLLDTAGPQLRAMILLGLNGGYGQKDCSDLQRAALERRPGWLDAARQKTGVGRRCPLWPETIEALDAVHIDRPDAIDPDDSGCVFLTTFGRRWVRYNDHGTEKRGVRIDAVALELKKAAKRAQVAMPGGFYVLRHVFRTNADGAKDGPAIDAIMGHVDESMGATYRESIGDDRLEAVTNHVRAWLLAAKPSA